MSNVYVPAQEIILVWVFVIDLHLQLLTRHFMDYDLTHWTHTDMRTDNGIRMKAVNETEDSSHSNSPTPQIHNKVK